MASKSKLHWTQRPENRAKVQRMATRAGRASARRRTGRPTPPPRQETTHDGIEEGTFGYALGWIECWLGTYASAAGVSQSALAARVGAVLHRKARG